MKVLTLDTSSVTACAGVVELETGEVLSEAFVNVPLTHSQTVLPMTQAALADAGLTLADIDLLAVCSGPGSFTGIRIGVAAAKGLGFERNMPCASVSTLAALAYNFDGIPFEGVVCAAMDARCQQVYTARFQSDGGTLARLSEDEAIAVEDCKKKLLFLEKPVIFVGDGANLCYNACKEAFPCSVAPAHLRFVRPYGIAKAARRLQQEGKLVTAHTLLPSYLRLPQAERELKRKQKG